MVDRAVDGRRGRAVGSATRRRRARRRTSSHAEYLSIRNAANYLTFALTERVTA